MQHGVARIRPDSLLPSLLDFKIGSIVSTKRTSKGCKASRAELSVADVCQFPSLTSSHLRKSDFQLGGAGLPPGLEASADFKDEVTSAPLPARQHVNERLCRRWKTLLFLEGSETPATCSARTERCIYLGVLYRLASNSCMFVLIYCWKFMHIILALTLACLPYVLIS